MVSKLNKYVCIHCATPKLGLLPHCIAFPFPFPFPRCPIHLSQRSRVCRAEMPYGTLSSHIHSAHCTLHRKGNNMPNQSSPHPPGAFFSETRSVGLPSVLCVLRSVFCILRLASPLYPLLAVSRSPASLSAQLFRECLSIHASSNLIMSRCSMLHTQEIVTKNKCLWTLGSIRGS